MIEDKYQQLCKQESDINEHLPILKKYALLSENIVELGVRGIVSTWALLAGHPKNLISLDIVHPSQHGGDVEETKKIAAREGVEWQFNQLSSLDVELPRHDLLFIDTIHEYGQLMQELRLHAPHTTKYIIMHDTVIPEMRLAISDFLLDNDRDWKIREIFMNNNGLTVLERI